VEIAVAAAHDARRSRMDTPVAPAYGRGCALLSVADMDAS
jgi:hypothetical protein